MNEPHYVDTQLNDEAHVADVSLYEETSEVDGETVEDVESHYAQ